jgi:hypothetical protein
MKVKIEDYRGFEMNFDIENEVFYCMSSSYDTETTKKSYASLKKWVDDYIKDNQTFTPVRLVKFSSTFQDSDAIILTGYRKDGRFTYSDKDGKLQQLSEYSEQDWFLPNDANTPILEEIIKLDNEINTLVAKKKQLDATLIKVDFKSVKRDYIPV